MAKPNLLTGTIRVALLTGLVVTLCVGTAYGQTAASADSSDVHAKDPTTALIFSFLLPGGGHLYAEDFGKGAALLLIGTGSLIYGLSHIKYECTPAPGEDDCSLGEKELALGLGIYAAAWIIGMADAGPAARRYNRRHGLGFGNTTITPFLARRGNGATRVGMNLTW